MKQTPLSSQDIINKVKLLNRVPDSFPPATAKVVADLLHRASAIPNAIVVLAAWPDGTWTILAHNSAWPAPRPEQLLRAYRQAFEADSNFLNNVGRQEASSRVGLIVSINHSE